MCFFALMSPDRLIVQKTLGNTNTMKLILSVRILINQTLHKPDSQTQHQTPPSFHCSCFSPSTCWSPCLLTPIQPWTSRSCPQQFWRPGQRNPVRSDRPIVGCCYLGQLCSLCSLLGYNLTKGKVKSLNSCRWVVFFISSCLLITLIKCLKGQRSLGSLIEGVPQMSLLLSLSLYLSLSLSLSFCLSGHVSSSLW